MVSGARAGDEICRYGGEEFLFILQNTEIEEGKEMAERVRTRIGSDAIHGKACGKRLCSYWGAGMNLLLVRRQPEFSLAGSNW
jgi:GGDEF domain-containing protein